MKRARTVGIFVLLAGSACAAQGGQQGVDYYFKKETRFEEARAKYLEHVQKMFELAGYRTDGAKAAAQTVMRMETSLAQHGSTTWHGATRRPPITK